MMPSIEQHAAAVYRLRPMTVWLVVAWAALVPSAMAEQVPFHEAASAAWAQLVGPDLAAQHVTLQTIRAGTVTYFDEQRMLRKIALDKLVEIMLPLPMPPPARAVPAARSSPSPSEETASDGAAFAVGRRIDLRLVDGQRYRGRFVGIDAVGRFELDHPQLGRLRAGLDTLASVRFAAPPNQMRQTPAPGFAGQRLDDRMTEDEVMLVNGDRLVGFVLGVEARAIVLDTGVDTQPLTVALDRVAGLRLANTTSNPRDGVSTSHLVLRDATRVAVTDLVLAAETITAKLAATERPIELSMAVVERIAVHGAAGRLVSLFDQPMRVVEPAEVFGLVWSPRLGAMSDPEAPSRDHPRHPQPPQPPKKDADRQHQPLALHLHAPTVVRFELPAGTVRLRATLALDLPTAEAGRELADLSVTIEQDGRALGRWSIHAAHARAVINMPIAAGPCAIRVEMGEHGPLLDRLRVEDARILIQP